ncbi:MAG: ATP-binding cassette domain-containing protein, partial [Deltaproteobacteria bacterium]|nr:ATP-binding cassette domain-containing protein [Deltaproteobacteria bacterium]
MDGGLEMSLIGIEDLSFGYDGRQELFSHLCLNLSDQWRLGLIGRNGRGKTTLFKILTGQLEYRGTIVAKARRLYFPFELEAGPTERASLELLGQKFPELREWDLYREAAALALKEDCFNRPLGRLSPGEVTKVKLAALFSLEGVFTLLYETSGGLDE